MAASIFLFLALLAGKIVSPFVALGLLNLVFAAVIVRYRVSLSVNTLNYFSDKALNAVLTKQKNYDQLFRAVSVVAFGYFYDNLLFSNLFLITASLMLIGGLIFSRSSPAG